MTLRHHSTTGNNPSTPPNSPRHIDQDHTIRISMSQHGYVPQERMGTTLQGSIWKVIRLTNNEKCIIKVSSIELHSKSVASLNGKEIAVKENIIKEASILKYLTYNNPPASITRYIDFFIDNKNYFLVMENGGTDLFGFVNKCHRLIHNKSLSIVEWQRFNKIAVKQITECISWMHKKMHVTHLDISLENFVISEVLVAIGESEQVQFFGEFQIKLIDFGLAEVFEQNKSGILSFNCMKYCGKTLYKSPKVYAKKEIFDARSADIWSLGVTLFSMITGVAPYSQPSSDNKAFQEVIQGNLFDVLRRNNKLSYITSVEYDLLRKIFKIEKYRIDIHGIEKHLFPK